MANSPLMGRSLSGRDVIVPASGEAETVHTAAASRQAATTANLGAAAALVWRGVAWCGVVIIQNYNTKISEFAMKKIHGNNF